MSSVKGAGKRVRVSHDWFWFRCSLIEKVSRVLLNVSHCKIILTIFNEFSLKCP